MLDRSRSFLGQVRVGTAELDNTNFAGGRMFRFGGGSGGRAALPIDDEREAIVEVGTLLDRDLRNEGR